MSLNIVKSDGSLEKVAGLANSQTATEALQLATTVNAKIGDLADLQTSVKTSVVNAINSIVPKAQSRPTVTIITTKSSDSSTSELTPADLARASASLLGSYLVTVYRNTSNSMTYFIGWIDASSIEISDCSFTKLAGAGTSLGLQGDVLAYSGGDSATKTWWIFEPIGSSQTDN